MTESLIAVLSDAISSYTRVLFGAYRQTNEIYGRAYIFVMLAAVFSSVLKPITVMELMKNICLYNHGANAVVFFSHLPGGY